MATEVILMQAVKAGGDRQILHEAIREHSMAAGRRVKEEGADNDLLQRIAADQQFASIHDKLGSLLDPALFVGRAPQQVEEFIADSVDPILSEFASDVNEAKIEKVNV
jgi:adenylosuccinate lyase